MLKIQVLGKGLIPRGHGIAPRKTPFDADLNLIKLILATGTFKVNMLTPATGKLIPLTNGNLQKMWNTYGVQKKVASKPTVTQPVKSSPVTPEVRNVPVSNPVPPVQQNKNKQVETVETKEEVKSDNSTKKEETKETQVENKTEQKSNQSFKPINNPNSK